MEKIRIIGLQSQKDRLVRELHRLGVIDIRKSKLEMQDDKPGDALPEISELLVRYHSAQVILDRYIKKNPPVPKIKEEQLAVRSLVDKAAAFKTVGEVLSMEERKTYLENELSRVEAASKVASLFVGSGIDFSKLSSNALAFDAYMLDSKARKAAHSLIHQLGEKYEVIENRVKEGSVIFVAYDKTHTDAMDKLEHVQNVRKIDISNEYLNSTAENSLAKLTELKNKAVKEKAEIVGKLTRYANADYTKIATFLEMLSVEEERASVSIGFKKTDATFIVEGWVEKKKVEDIRRHMRETSGDRFSLEEIDADELAPTLVKRSRFLRPFDKIVEFFSLPRSDELNPTWIFIITFPIFYGLMVSDVGYGLASFAFAYLITKVSDPDDILYNVAKLWQISSISVIFFGFLSNQYFGFQLNQYFTSFVGFDWLKSPTTILAATVVFGIAQVILGLVFSVYNNYHHGHKKIAISKITSIIAIITGTLAICGFLFNMVGPSITQVSTYLLIGSLVLTIILSGQEATEIVSLISHPLSYARIMGFGLASVILALLIDKAFTPSLSGGILSFAFTFIIFILLHFVNMLLGTFEGLVQAVRLNFVEFFSKFYTGGGTSFKPFSFKRRYTKEV